MIPSGYFIARKNEIAASYTQITPENSVASIMIIQKEYVLGFSDYFNKHGLKFQSDLIFNKWKK